MAVRPCCAPVRFAPSRSLPSLRSRRTPVARFRPFRAVRYASSRVGAMDGVVAPPYDVISPAERDAFYEASPFNCTRLILNKQGHDAAADQYRAWQAEGVL